MRLSVLLESGRVREARFQVRGCTASIAAGSALTEMLSGKTIEQLSAITSKDVEAALDGLIPESKHAAVLCVDAIRAVLRLAAR
jgi:NifU-like protein involved in Fe-S cluster formation